MTTATTATTPSQFSPPVAVAGGYSRHRAGCCQKCDCRAKGRRTDGPCVRHRLRRLTIAVAAYSFSHSTFTADLGVGTVIQVDNPIPHYFAPIARTHPAIGVQMRGGGASQCMVGSVSITLSDLDSAVLATNPVSLRQEESASEPARRSVSPSRRRADRCIGPGGRTDHPGYTIDIQIVEDPQVEIDAETPWHLAPEDHNRNRKGPNAQPSRPAL